VNTFIDLLFLVLAATAAISVALLVADWHHIRRP